MSSVGPSVNYNNELEALQNAPPGEAVENLDRVLGYVHAIENADGVGQATAVTVGLGYMNAVALLLGTIVITYVVLTSIVKTAAEGKVLGRSWSNVTLPLAASISLAAIIPTSLGGGYISSAQAVITYALVKGSNAADYVWRISVDQAMTTPPLMLPAVEGRRVAITALKALTCENVIANAEMHREPIVKKVNSAIQIGQDGECGKFDLPVFDESFDGGNISEVLLAGAKNDALRAASVETMKLISELRPIAKMIAEKGFGLSHVIYADEQVKADKKLKPYYDKFEALADGYSAKIHSAVYSAYTNSNSGVADALKKYLKSLGWWRAGIAFTKLSSFQASAADVVDIVTTSVSFSLPPKEQLRWAIDDDKFFLPVYYVDKFVRKSLGGKQIDPIDFVQESGRVAGLDVDSVCNKTFCDGLDAYKKLGRWTASLFVGGEKNSDIVSWERGLGGRLLAAGTTLFIAEGGLRLARGVADGTGKTFLGGFGAAVATSPLAEAVSHVIDLFRDFRWIAIVAGTMLKVAPAIPAVLWAFAVVGWIVQAVALIVAAPLAMVLRFDPDDPKFLGGISNRWYMHILAICIRPTLMVIGLFLSMSLSVLAYPLISDVVLMAVMDNMDNPFAVVGVAVMIAFAMFIFSLYLFGLPLSFANSVSEMTAPGSAGDGGGINTHDTLSIGDKGQNALEKASRNAANPKDSLTKPPRGGLA